MMHRCLRIAEILDMIVSFAYGNADKKELATVASLARTSLTFKDPALDLLWREQHSLIPLMNCLPSYSFPATRILRKDQPPEGIIHHREWSRFMFYSTRVRRLFVYSPENQPEEHQLPMSSVPSEVFRFLRCNTFGLNLFPNLAQLGWHESIDAERYPYFDLFLGPKITTLSILLHPDNPSTPDIFSNIVSLSPCIKTFNFITSGRYLQFFPELSEFACNLQAGITAFNVSGCFLSNDAFMHLACLPTLEEVSLTEVSRPPPEDFEDRLFRLRSSTVPVFPSVTAFVIATTSIEPCIAIISLAQSHKLEQISISACDPPSAATFQLLLDTLIKKHPLTRTTLWELSINKTLDPVEHPSTWDPTYIITKYHIQPLLSFSNLILVDINPTCYFDLDNLILQEMAMSWPRLEVLDLGSECGWQRHSRITLQGLIPLVEHCPMLERLGLVINAQPVPSYSDSNSGASRPFSSRIEVLHVGDSMVEKPTVDVALFLFDLFPKVQEIKVCEGMTDFDSRKRRWCEVEGMLKAFNQIRVKERTGCWNTDRQRGETLDI